PESREHLEFTRRVLALRRAHPGLRRRWFLNGKAVVTDEIKDITWMRADGVELAGMDWNDPEIRALAVMLRDEDDSAPALEHGGAPPLLLMLLNGAPEPCVFQPPAAGAVVGDWQEI